MVCDFRIVDCGADGYLLSMQRGICDQAAAIFGKYIVFSAAEIGNASDDWCTLAVWGEDAANVLSGGAGLNTAWQDNGRRWVQTDGDGQRYECHVPTALAQDTIDELAAHCERASEEHWQLLEIQAGLGHLEAATVEMFIPQMLNFQLTGHISFNKGCYTGQEVVARLHYRGKLKRPMYLASIESDAPVTAGEPLFKAGSEQSIGNVVNSVMDGSSRYLLAVVTTTALNDGVRLASPEGPLLSFHPLPYALPD